MGASASTVRRRPLLFAALGAALLTLPLLGPGEMQCKPIPVEPPRDVHCDDGTPLLCDALEPTCERGLIAAIQDGCWVCVDPHTCAPPRDAHCDDGTEPLCDRIPPVCGPHEILAWQDDCYVCVNPATCVPWGQPGCESDRDCPVDAYCNDCATGSCPMCLDCVAGCMEHGCPTEPEPRCNAVRPDCEGGAVAVVRDGCWVCVGLNACAPMPPLHDPQCDDGTQPVCAMIPPVCHEFEILAYQNHCYVCVNAATCHPWGEPGCRTAADCDPWESCDPCGTSSCPACDDCVPACLPRPD